jgi:hypothetical protein
MSRIKTTGELRQFLADSILAVKNGHMDADTARNVTKLAAQINESFYSEVKIAKTAKEMGKPSCDLGDLPINK